MATSVVNPRAQFFANNGRPLIGGRIHTYVAGSSTRARTYKDATKAQPNTNPIVLDGRGEAQIYLAEGVEYKFVVEDSKGALIYTQEPVYGAVWPNAEQWPSDATLSYQYMTEAKAAAGAIGPIKFYDNLAEAQADIANLTEGDLVELARDEEFGGARTRRSFLAGALAFAVNLDQLRIDLDSDKGALRVADAVARVATLQDLKALPKPSRKTVVRVDGYADANDGGGGDYLFMPASSKEANGITVIAPDSGGGGRWERGLDKDGAIHFSLAGIFPGLAIDQTGKINSLLNVASKLKCKVKCDSGEYIHNGYLNTDLNYHFDLECVGPSKAKFTPTTAALQNADVRLFRCEPDADSVLLAGTLAQTAYVNDRGFYLTDTTGINPGMVFQISSSVLWPYDPRDIYTKGELNTVKSVNHATKFVQLDGPVRDSYIHGGGRTYWCRAWKPCTFKLKNVELDTPSLAGVTHATVGTQVSMAYEPEHTDVVVRGMRNWGLKTMRCIRPRFSKIRGYDCGAGLANGYAFQDNSSIGLVGFDVQSIGCRRLFDAHGGQGTAGAPSRDWLIMNFHVTGGGAYFPDTAEESYGLGMHGPTEFGKFAHGYIRDVSFGVNVRSRNIEIDNVQFAGNMIACISASYGVGLDVRNCVADSNNYVDRTQRSGDIGIIDFIRLGIGPASVDPNFLYTLPIVAKGNTLRGVRSSFARFMAPTKARNLDFSGNTIDARPLNDGSYIHDGVFRMLATASAGGAYYVAGSIAGNNVEVTGGSYSMRATNMSAGDNTSGVIEPLRIENKEWLATMPKDTVLKIPRFCQAGHRPVVSINADAAGMAMVRVLPASATLTAVGSGNTAIYVGSATPEALNGSTGNDGNITLGVTAEGDFWLENRAAGNAKQFRISRIS